MPFLKLQIMFFCTFEIALFPNCRALWNCRKSDARFYFISTLIKKLFLNTKFCKNNHWSGTIYNSFWSFYYFWRTRPGIQIQILTFTITGIMTSAKKLYHHFWKKLWRDQTLIMILQKLEEFVGEKNRCISQKKNSFEKNFQK